MEKHLSDENVFIMEGARVVGDATFGKGSSVWYGATVRADQAKMTFGKRCALQENVVCHSDSTYEVVLEDDVVVGHCAIIHGTKIGHHTLVGMGAILMNGSEVGDHCLIAAGSLLTQGKKFPSGMLIMGSPAKAVRPLTEAEYEQVHNAAEHYELLAEKQKDLTVK